MRKPKPKNDKRQIPDLSMDESFYNKFFKKHGIEATFRESFDEVDSTQETKPTEVRSNKASFNPMLRNLPFTQLKQGLSLPFPEASNSKTSTVLNLPEKRAHKLNVQKVLALSIMFILTAVALVGLILGLTNEQNKTKNQNTSIFIPQELLELCEGDAAEVARFKINQNINSRVQNETTVIQNLELRCFPKNPFKHVEEDLEDTVELINVTIQVVAAGALADEQLQGKDLRISDSTIRFFDDQEGASLREFSVETSKIELLPSNLHIDSVSLIGLIDFEFISENSKFLTRAGLKTLFMKNFLEDVHLRDLRDSLKGLEEKLIFTDVDTEFGGIFIENNFLTKIPSEMFTTKILNIDSETFSFIFRESDLVEIAVDAFDGQNSFLCDFGLTENEGITELPEAVSELNLRSLDISGTNITSFGTLKVSDFPNLELLNFRETVLDPSNCAELRDLQEELEIGNFTVIEGFDLDCL
eukprot:snap_masked-scaffold_39-processed-gene-1.16-mRNA-1 protein AED:1.00 eAED:1.00 QI:0/-1/0/0/-1/1/1/0/471